MNVYGELTRAQLENLTADPTLAAATKGRLWMRTDLSNIKIDLGGSAETIAMLAATQIFTNKSIDAATNTITNISNTEVKAGAGIVYSKLTLTTSVKATDMNSQAASAGAVLTADGAGGASYSSIPASPDSSMFYENGSIAASVATNALTVTLKDKSGATPTGSSLVSTAFRNATSATGTYAMVNVTGALSVVAPDLQSLGLTIGATSYLYVYLINNAGTAELALSASNYWDEGRIQNTTAIASASSATTLYSTTARTGVAIRLIGRITIVLAASTHWSNAPTEISNVPIRAGRQIVPGTAQTVNGTTASATYATPSNAPTVTFTAERTALYKVYGLFNVANSGALGNEAGARVAATAGSPTVVQQADGQFTNSTANGDCSIAAFIIAQCVAGTSYTFTMQMKVGGGNTATLLNATVNHALTAEEMT